MCQEAQSLVWYSKSLGYWESDEKIPAVGKTAGNYQERSVNMKRKTKILFHSITRINGRKQEHKLIWGE